LGLAVKILHAQQPPTQNRVIEVVLDGFFGKWMRKRNWAGTTIPLPLVTVILYYTVPDAYTRTHEFVHVEQRQALGLFGFWFNYIRDAIKFGYQKNPLELDAYQVEAAAQKNGAPAWAQVQP
jgi:hypothetical protein